MHQKRGPTSAGAFLLIFGISSLVLLAGCGLANRGSSPAPARVASGGGEAAATAEPSPTPSATNTPVVIPTPLPPDNQTDVENLVLSRIMDCAGDLFALTGSRISPDFTTTYSFTEGEWTVEAFTRSPALSFGIWRIIDATGEVTPLDNVALGIDTPGINCLPPVATRARGRTPPLFGTPTPTPKNPTPTSGPPPTATPAPPFKVRDPEDAAVAVWVSVYSCYGHFPQLGSFTATEDGPDRWVVEGRSPDTVYGLWSVDKESAEVTPVDDIARQAEEDCLKPLVGAVALNPVQAALRVWMASYQCFNPPPKFEFFVAYLITPQLWVVEGRESEKKEDEAVVQSSEADALYGFWLVDTDTGVIQPWDDLAIRSAASPCFKPLELRTK